MSSLALETPPAPSTSSHESVSQEIVEQMFAARMRIVPLSVEQYHRMIETGILEEGAPIELLDGVLVYKDRSARGEDPMSIGTLHALCIDKLIELNAIFRPHGCYLRAQAPTTLRPAAEPEPDGQVLRGVPNDYREHHPGPADSVCAIEVSDSSLRADRTVKLKKYARTGVFRYIIVNIPDRQIEIHAQPVPAEGRYARQDIVRAGEIVAFELPDGITVNVPAENLLP